MKPQTPQMFRQGDVLVIATDEAIPTGAKKAKREGGRVVLAHGEVTGHAHAILDREVELYKTDTDTTADAADAWLKVQRAEGAALVHEEHATIHLPEGTYRVR